MKNLQAVRIGKSGIERAPINPDNYSQFIGGPPVGRGGRANPLISIFRLIILFDRFEIGLRMKFIGYVSEPFRGGPKYFFRFFFSFFFRGPRPSARWLPARSLVRSGTAHVSASVTCTRVYRGVRNARHARAAESTDDCRLDRVRFVSVEARENRFWRFVSNDNRQ